MVAVLRDSESQSFRRLVHTFVRLGRPITTRFNSMATSSPPVGGRLQTRVLSTSLCDAGTFHLTLSGGPPSFLSPWTFDANPSTPSGANLLAAVDALRTAVHPVAFPTETVYGLGAAATSSAAVRAVFTAKGRPADNPLIVHVASLEQLRGLLTPTTSNTRPSTANGRTSGGSSNVVTEEDSDPIPPIYRPLIQRFWPGPVTILLPLPNPSPLAPEVSAGQQTFGARMPSSQLALALIRTAGVPVAAPSANASGRPSPTTAQHVAEDLAGRIEIVLDGGPCAVGVESTVVDGLGPVPSVLRPGGVGVEEIRRVEGWEACEEAWRTDEHRRGRSGPQRENGADGGPPDEEWRPRAPGMKYRHYAPKARVVLVSPKANEDLAVITARAAKDGTSSIGYLRTKRWQRPRGALAEIPQHNGVNGTLSEPLKPLRSGNQAPHTAAQKHKLAVEGRTLEIWDLCLGRDTANIARSLFWGLRELDSKNVDVIYVEGIEEDGEASAAVMNRLRKAAEDLQVIP